VYTPADFVPTDSICPECGDGLWLDVDQDELYCRRCD
jgi:ribosomal protein S27AE